MGVRATYLQASSLLERDEELGRIDVALEAAQRGAGSFVFIEGPAGIGKTELVLAARRRAGESGMTLASARGSELEREFAFGVVRQLLAPFVAGADAQARAELFSGAAGLAESLFAAEPTPGPADTEDRTFAMLHGLHWLCANLAQRDPLLLAIDDAHWSDIASLRFLAYLVQRREGLPLAIVVASRPAETPAEEEVLVRLATDPQSPAIAPAPLSAEAVATLLRDGLDRDPAPEVVQACHAVTGGTPFLLRGLIREIDAQGLEPVAGAASQIENLGPRTIARAVVARVRRLAPAALVLARAAAVLGGDADPRRVARLGGVDEAVAAAAVDSLAGAGVVMSGSPIEFVHPILRSAIYSEMPAGERSALHARAADLLSEEGAAEERIASHVLATNPTGDEHAVELLLHTSRTAIARGAPASAVSYLERALAEPPAGELLIDVLEELGGAEVARGRADRFEPHFRRAIEVCSDPERRARIGLALARARLFAGDLPEAWAALDSALAELDDPASPLVAALEAELFQVGLNYYPAMPPLASRLWERVAHLEAGEVDHPSLVAALALALTCLRPPARVGADIAERVARGDLMELSTWAHGAVGNALLFAGRLREGGEYYDRLVAAARARAWRGGSHEGGGLRGNASLQEARVRRAEDEARVAFESMHERAGTSGGPALLIWSGSFVVDALVERGALEEAEEIVAGISPVEELPPLYSRSLWIAARGRLRLAQGRPADALADALAAQPRSTAVNEVKASVEDALASASFTMMNPATLPWASDAAWALRALDRADDGRTLAEQELAAARQFDVPIAIGRALRAVAACSRPDAALEVLAEAVDVLERSEGRLELAHALVDYGSALRRAKRRRECREPLRQGLDIAHRGGALPLAERARTELLATGARPRRAVLSGVESLTPSERRVADLAAQGLTNREIAQALFVTARTVEGHLTHVYQKLDVASREDLGERLAAETASA